MDIPGDVLKEIADLIEQVQDLDAMTTLVYLDSPLRIVDGDGLYYGDLVNVDAGLWLFQPHIDSAEGPLGDNVIKFGRRNT